MRTPRALDPRHGHVVRAPARRVAQGLAAAAVVLALVVLTIAVGVGSTSDTDQTRASNLPRELGLSSGSPDGADPLGAARSIRSVNLDGPTAALPPGGAYTVAGTGRWHVIPRTGPPPPAAAEPRGRRVVTFTVEAEDGLDPGSYAGDDAFAGDVEAILADPRGWTSRKNITLRRIDTGTPDFRISLTSPMTTRAADLCGFDIRYEGSCFNPAAGRVVIDLARWTRGAMAYGGDLGAYREYAISHEVGHALGENHQPCPAPGAPAPVMMQQTYGTNNAYVHQLNQADPAGHDIVPANGDTCRPNPWPALSPRP